MKTILVTGGAGFLGSHLCDRLIDAGDEVICVDNFFTGRKDNIRHLSGRVNFHDGDLRDLASLISLLSTTKPEIIFHLAAQSYVKTSYAAPSDTVDTNVIGTVNLLEAVRITGLQPIIHICSSSEVYGQVEEENVPIKEDCPLRPVSPYAVSKVGEDMAAYMYWKAYGIKTIWDPESSLGKLDEVFFEAGDHQTLVRVSGVQFHELMAPAERGRFSHHV